jgi:hypothetical protein
MRRMLVIVEGMMNMSKWNEANGILVGMEEEIGIDMSVNSWNTYEVIVKKKMECLNVLKHDQGVEELRDRMAVKKKILDAQKFDLAKKS